MIKKLKIPQPYAEMTVRGLVSVIKLDTGEKETHGRIYIYATAPVINPKTPLEWRQEVENHVVFGNLPPTEELPTNRLIGFVDVVRTVPFDYNVWTLGMRDCAYLVTNAHYFVTPFILNPDEIDLNFIRRANTCMFMPRQPFFRENGDELVIPVSDFIYQLAWSGNDFNVELTEDFAKLVLGKDGNLKPFTRFSVWRGNQAKRFIVDDETMIRHSVMDDGSDLCWYPSVVNPKGVAHVWLHFSCRHPLND